MPNFVKTYGGSTLTAKRSLLSPDEVIVFTDHSLFARVEGAELRDWLLEAFPLEAPAPSGAPERLAEWEKELRAAMKPKQVPGEVYSDGFYKGFVILPDGRYYDLKLHRSYTYPDFATDSLYKRVFDPRGAKALPSPLGIRVGDTVRRVTQGRGGPKVTVEFEVNHICPEGGLSAKYGPTYDGREFKVISRGVPDRLPAGTITRPKRNRDGLCLRLQQGFLNLQTGQTWPEDDGPGYSLEHDVNEGHLEVIYLPGQ